MRLIVIDAEQQTYTLYEDRKMLAEFQADELLDAGEVEELRVMNLATGVPA
jgi:hypothetical protein